MRKTPSFPAKAFVRAAASLMLATATSALAAPPRRRFILKMVSPAPSAAPPQAQLQPRASDSTYPSFALDFCGKRGELLSANAPAGMEAHLFVGDLVCRTPMPHACRVTRALGLVLEGQDNCHEGLRGRYPG